RHFGRLNPIVSGLGVLISSALSIIDTWTKLGRPDVWIFVCAGVAFVTMTVSAREVATRENEQARREATELKVKADTERRHAAIVQLSRSVETTLASELNEFAWNLAFQLKVEPWFSMGTRLEQTTGEPIPKRLAYLRRWLKATRDLFDMMPRYPHATQWPDKMED